MKLAEKEGLPAVFESTDVEKLLGISSTRLNKFIERRLYGIRPSIRSGIGRGRRRLFSREDVFGIALVWWLFEAGFRSPVIQSVLNDLGGRKAATSANAAAENLLTGDAKFLWIQRKGRSTTASAVTREAPAIRALLAEPSISLLIVPVETRFAKLKQAMKNIGKAE